MSSLEDAQRLAHLLEGEIEKRLATITLPRPVSLFIGLRAYLSKRADEIDAANDVSAGLKMLPPSGIGDVLMNYGPTIDKGETEDHFHFDSGARLCFGITIRARSHREYDLIAYRFHYHLPDAQNTLFLRFDLNPNRHENPLSEPRCHLHPGLEPIRIPLPVLSPFEVLDRIFFVAEPAINSRGASE